MYYTVSRVSALEESGSYELPEATDATIGGIMVSHETSQDATVFVGYSGGKAMCDGAFMGATAHDNQIDITYLKGVKLSQGMTPLPYVATVQNIVNSVSGTVQNGNLRITVNGVESGDIPLPQTDTFLPFTNVKDINQAPNGYLFTDKVLVSYDTSLEYSPDSFPWNGYDSINDLYNDIKKYDGKNYGINFNPGHAGIAPVSIKLSNSKIIIRLEVSSMYNVIILPLHSD